MRKLFTTGLSGMALVLAAGCSSAPRSPPAVPDSDAGVVQVAPPTGDRETDRVSILGALSEVEPGGTVQFAPGTYLMGGQIIRITVPRITLAGHPEGTTLRGCHPDEFPMQDTAEFGNNCNGLELAGGWQTVRNLTFEHAFWALHVGCCWDGRPHMRAGEGGHLVEGNTFRSNSNAVRVHGDWSEPTVVRNNRFLNNWHSVAIYGNTVHLVDNDISAPEPEEVQGTGFPADGIHIARPMSLHEGAEGVTRTCQNNVVSGNRIDGVTEGIMVTADDPQIICRNNVIRDNTITIRRARPPVLPGFIRIHDEADSTVVGVPLALRGAVEDNLIESNVIRGAEGLGIEVRKASRNRIVNNTISGVAYREPFPGNAIAALPVIGGDPEAWRQANGSGIWVSPESDENEIRGNVFEDIAGAAVVLEGDSNRVELEDASSVVRDLGSGNRVTAPNPVPAAQERAQTDRRPVASPDRARVSALAYAAPQRGGGSAVPDRNRSPSPELDALRDRIDAIRREAGVPSAQVAILTPEETVLWNFGVADPAAGTPVTDETMFRAGSISKSFAGIALLMLVERHLVRLDDELRVLAPELDIRNPWRVSHPVRLSHLLEAGAGFVGFQGYGDQPDDSPEIPLDRVIDELPHRLDVQWRPGEYTAYHNLGPVITAYLVEKLTGEPYEEFVRKNIFLPLGMDRSSFFRTEAVAESLAWAPFPERPGASEDEGKPRPDPAIHYEHIRARPSGALNTSAAELAAFVRMLLDRGAVDGREILRQGTVERFETPTSTVAARRLAPGRGHALNNWTSTYEGILYHGHGGRIDRYTAYYAYSPERGSGFVYMGTRGGSGEELHYPVSTAILEALHPEAEPPPALETTAEQRSDFAGCYELVNPRSLREPLRHLRVRSDGGRLLLDLPPVEDTPGYTTELEPWKLPSLFRVERKRLERSGESPWTDELAFVTDDRGVLIAEFLSFPHDAYERVSCRGTGAGGADPEVEGPGRR